MERRQRECLIFELDRLALEWQSLDTSALSGSVIDSLRRTSLEAILGLLGASMASCSSLSTALASITTITDQQVIVAFFLRTMDQFDQITATQEERADLVDLFDRVLGDSLYPRIGVSTKSQNYEKLNALRTVRPEAEMILNKASAEFSQLDTLRRWQQSYMKAIHSPYVKSAIYPFLPSWIDGAFLKDILNDIDYYSIERDSELALNLHERAVEASLRLIVETKRFETGYSSVFVVPIAERIKSAIDDCFRESAASRPADITVLASEKKYPFHNKAAKLRLRIDIVNKGSGIANEVTLEVGDADGVIVPSVDRFLGRIGAGTRISVDIEASPLAGCESATVLLVVRWLDSNRKDCSHEEIVEFRCQKADTDWDELSVANPFSLEAVSSEEELAGRGEFLRKLVAQSRRNTMSSSLIYGQRRVGKTSIVRTYQRRVQEALEGKVVVAYLESGDYRAVSADETVNRLGAALCRELRDAHPSLELISIPEFSGALSPVGDFLRAARRVLPDMRYVIILVEFEELPLELVIRGDRGDALFQTIRSLSQKEEVLFVLVGSEKMEQLINTQGEKLNKFASLRVDYFSRDTEWSDFMDLVRRPVQGEIDFSDRAVAALFDYSAGNPYFTKLICQEVIGMMVERRDNHVTDGEVREAVDRLVPKLSVTSFSHFWEDGILQEGPVREEISRRRRKVLLALARIVRRGRELTSELMVEEARGAGLDAAQAVAELNGFVRRRLLTEGDGKIEFTVPLFKKWISEVGSREILLDVVDEPGVMARWQAEEAAKIEAKEMTALLDAWPLYRGREVSESRVREWLVQFGGPLEQRAMFTLLRGVRFYSDAMVREKLREAHSHVVRGTKRVVSSGREKRRDIAVSYLAGPGKSGARLANRYASENGISRELVVEPMRLLPMIEHGELSVLVLVDDIIGTGRSADGYLEGWDIELGETLRRTGLKVVLVAVTGFKESAQTLEEKYVKRGWRFEVFCCDELGPHDRCFSGSSEIFHNRPDERLLAQRLAVEKGREIEPRCPMGFGDCELGIVFAETCPNNSISILWSNNRGWTPLFSRQ